jgi:hypothetical protein
LYPGVRRYQEQRKELEGNKKILWEDRTEIMLEEKGSIKVGNFLTT